MNRQEARSRLAELIRRATERPKPRRPTKPTYSSKLKRLEAKSQRSGIKSGRGRVRGRWVGFEIIGPPLYLRTGESLRGPFPT